ncbi:unnamed protein product [Boreogadus saida]
MPLRAALTPTSPLPPVSRRSVPLGFPSSSARFAVATTVVGETQCHNESIKSERYPVEVFPWPRKTDPALFRPCHANSTGARFESETEIRYDAKNQLEENWFH